MKRTQVRKGIFETNSSSTHAIYIPKNGDLNIPKTLRFEYGYFGWEYDTFNFTHKKASYLFTALMKNNMEGRFFEIVKMLLDKGIDVDYSLLPPVDLYEGIDHHDELGDFLQAMQDDERVLRFLFSHDAFVITGNDNYGHEVVIDLEYPHEMFYKTN
jgi:hypothetical protein